MALQQGQVLNNRYRIANPIGQGGFGAVYRAWDLRMNGPCVIKESLETNPETASQFEREAQILFRLKHPGLPVVYDYFDLPDQGLYLVMEFVDGQNLGDILASRKILPEAEAVDWIIQVSEALEYLHKQDPPVIHRDIKPQNIIITPAGKAVLVDFGVAKVFRANQQTTLGARAATPGYSPPEQFLQSGTDERSDIYSLGATLYTLLTGKVPPESVARSLEEELPDIHLFTPSVSRATCRAVETAMAYKKKDRFANAAEFRHVLTTENKKSKRPVQGKPEISSPSVIPASLQTKKVSSQGDIKKGWYQKAWVWLAGAAFLVLLIAGGFLISKGMLFGAPTEVSIVEKTLSVTPTDQAVTQPTAVLISNNKPRTYLFIDIPASWKEASDYCDNLGGYLVTINSADENEHVLQISNGGIWLGATDEMEEGTWVWVSDEPWEFTYWAQNQPDNFTNEDFLTLGSYGEDPARWNDAPPGDFMPFVCEWESEIITVTSTEDNGAGTLRQAIQSANPGDIIKFSSTAFPQKDPARIMLQSGLPVINQGYLTLDASNAGVILDGSEAGGDWTPGLEINSAYNIIKGFQIINFTGPGILLSTQARHNLIGGDKSVGLGLLGEGNLISNNQDGIAIFWANNTITGNLIGTDINGTGSRGNLAAGIFLEEDANRNTIGPDNIITSSGAGEGGGGVEIRDLALVENFITANSIHSNAGPGISYNIENLELNDLPPSPKLLFYDFNNGLASGTTCVDCHVEIFSTDSQDGKIFEGAAVADGYGNFILEKGSAFTLPFLTATVYMPGRNTSEFSNPVTSQSPIQAAFDLTRNEMPLFQTSFDDGNFSITEGKNARIEEGKLIISSEDQERATVQLKHLRSDQYAVEFDLQARDSTEDAHCIFETGDDGQLATPRSLSAGFSPNYLSAFLWKSNYGNLAETAYEPDQNNTFTLIIIGSHIGAYLNGKFAYAALDTDGSAEYVWQQLTASNTITCEFDNYKLWDLSGKELNP